MNNYSISGKKRIAATLAAACTLVSAAAQSPAPNATPAPPPPSPPPPKWDPSAAVGLTLTEGNSDTVQFSVITRADKKFDPHELHFGADFTYGESEDIKNNETVRAFGQYNRLFTDRWFGDHRELGDQRDSSGHLRQ